MSVKLIAIGDSLTQGFKSGSISQTHLSYPAIIARCLGENNFKIPDFSGEGGLPFNLEALLNRLAERYGDRLDWTEFLPAVLTTHSFLDRIEDYWERGVGIQVSNTGPLHHNLAIWGFQLGDAYRISEFVSHQYIPPASDDLLINRQIPEAAQYRTARRTLNPSFHYAHTHLTQITAAQKLVAEQGGNVENLIFWLGANHCLASVARLVVEESDAREVDLLPHERTATLWKPEHFHKILELACQKLAEIPAQRVFIANVPHVTIPPISRGVTPNAIPGQEQDAEGYFAYYTHFWIWDRNFSPARHKHLTRDQIRHIDRTIDQYNQLIAAIAQNKGWHLVDVCSLLDSLAFRRRQGAIGYQFPDELVSAMKNNPLTADRIVNGQPLLDSRYIRINPNGTTPQERHQGGLFSLDAIHPTTVAYGIVAHEFLKVMKRAGVDHQPIDWNWVVANDSLLTSPPANLSNLQDILGFLFSRTPLPELLKIMGGLNPQA
jgi:hypothetical protein